MKPELSRRLAKIMYLVTEGVDFEKIVKVRAEFVEEVSKYKTFEDMPKKLQEKIIELEKKL